MSPVVVLPELYARCGLHTTEVVKIKVELERRLRDIETRRKRKWLENVPMGGAIYGVSCRRLENEDIEITNIKKNRKPQQW